MFFINQPLFLKKTKKLSLYIQILNIYLGFEFGPQRIRDLLSLRVSVVRGMKRATRACLQKREKTKTLGGGRVCVNK